MLTIDDKAEIAHTLRAWAKAIEDGKVDTILMEPTHALYIRTLESKLLYAITREVEQCEGN